MEEIIVPYKNHILVSIFKDRNQGKVYIPTSIKDSHQEGVVLSIGKGVDTELPDGTNLQEGDRIRWEKYAEADGIFDYKNLKVCLVKDSQVMGVFVERKVK